MKFVNVRCPSACIFSLLSRPTTNFSLFYRCVTASSFCLSVIFFNALLVVDGIIIVCSIVVINTWHYGSFGIRPSCSLLSICMKLRKPLLIGKSEPHTAPFNPDELFKEITSTMSRSSLFSRDTNLRQNHLLTVWATQDESQFYTYLVAREWHFVALIVDRIFFFIFLFVSVVFSLFVECFMFPMEEVNVLPGLCINCYYNKTVSPEI